MGREASQGHFLSFCFMAESGFGRALGSEGFTDATAKYFASVASGAMRSIVKMRLSNRLTAFGMLRFDTVLDSLESQFFAAFGPTLHLYSVLCQSARLL